MVLRFVTCREHLNARSFANAPNSHARWVLMGSNQLVVVWKDLRA